MGAILVLALRYIGATLTTQALSWLSLAFQWYYPGLIWRYHTLAIVWRFFASTVASLMLALPWRYPGSTLALPWRYPGTIQALPRHYQGANLVLTWS